MCVCAGNYQGNFKAVRKARKPNQYEKGYSGISKSHGTQEQADCAWLGLRSIRKDQTGYDIGVAFWRHILNKQFGLNLESNNQQINPSVDSADAEVVSTIGFDSTKQ